MNIATEEISVLEDVERYLMASNKSKLLLLELGISPEIKILLRKGLENMKLVGGESTTDPQRKQLQLSLQKLRDALL